MSDHGMIQAFYCENILGIVVRRGLANSFA